MQEGSLNRAEMRRVVLGVKPEFSDDELAHMFDIVDVDKDGTIDITEFSQAVEKAKRAPPNPVHEEYHCPIKLNRFAPCEEEMKYPEPPRTGLKLGKYLDRRAKKNNERFCVDKYGVGFLSCDAQKLDRAKMRANRMKDEQFRAVASATEPGSSKTPERWRWDASKRKKELVTPGLVDTTCAVIPLAESLHGRTWAIRQK